MIRELLPYVAGAASFTVVLGVWMAGEDALADPQSDGEALHAELVGQDHHGDMLYMLGLELAAEGSYEAALQHFDRAIEKLPRAEVHDARASTLANMGRVTEALESAEAAVALDPENAVYRSNRAQLYREFGRTDEAREDLEAALDQDPSAVAALFNRGVMSFEAGDHEAALADFTAIVETDPHVGAAWFNTAMVHEALGDEQAAIDAMEHFLDLLEDENDKGLAMELIARWGGA